MLFRCSYHQARLWFIDKFESGNLYTGSPVYHNIPIIAALEGPLDIALLESSLMEVVSAHPILRTGIKDIDGIPFQVISPSCSLNIIVDNSLYGMPDSEWASLSASTYELLLSDIKRPFDLSSSLLRV